MAADHQEMQDKLWKSLKDDMTVMLSLTGVDEGHSRPMTAQLDADYPGQIWFFTSSETELLQAVGDTHRAVAHFVAKDHDLFATLHGELRLETDRAMVDKLWNRFVAAWYEGGKDDPKLRLLRLDAESAQIWRNEHSVFAGVKLLLGIDPKRAYKDKVAEVPLRH